ENHLGLSHEQAIESFINLLARGMWRSQSDAQSPSRQRKSRDYLATLRAMHKDVRDRVSYIRFLSGRLWISPPDMPPNDSESKGGRQTPPMLFFPEIPSERIVEI